MNEVRWIELAAVLALHEDALADFGGLPGIRDEGALRSALARPMNLAAYEGETDLFRLAASYAFGVAKNHAFSDGNKRTAYAVAGAFLSLNGIEIRASGKDEENAVVAVAEGQMSEKAFAEFLRNRQE